MIFTETRLKGAFIVDIDPVHDERGFFTRAFCQKEFAAHGLKNVFAQANIGFNIRKGTVRGMHFQTVAAPETKFVRATRGAVLDVIVDLRPESPTYLESVAVELSAENRRALYIPERFAHGYQALDDNTETMYHAGEFFAPDAAGGLRFDDPRLGLGWPLPVTVVSAKDRVWPLLSECETDLKARMMNTKERS